MSLDSNTTELNEILDTMNNLPLGGGGLRQISEMIDESGVLDSTEGTVEEKVEELIEIIEENTLPDWNDDSPIIASGYGYAGYTRAIWEVTEKGTMRWKSAPNGTGIFVDMAGWNDSIAATSCPREYLAVANKIRQVYVPDEFKRVYLGFLTHCERMRLPQNLSGLGLRYSGLKEIKESSKVNSPEFSCPTNYALEKIILSENRTTLSSYFASQCAVLKEVINIEKITSFNQNCFYECVLLSGDMVFNPDLIKIDSQAFGRTGFTKITFQNAIDSLPTISNRAFDQCEQLTEIYCPWAEGAVANAPWGATNATIHYNTQFDADGNPIAE